MSDENELMDGRYRILQPIGEGDLGAVYMATDMETGQICALKPIQPPDEATLEEVRQETARIQALDHPHIAPPGVLSGQHEPYLVRDFIEGKTLDEVLRWEAPLTLARACSLAKQIAMALEAAHHAGMIHGDLKPARVLLTGNQGEETVRVLGFGILPLKKSRFINLARLAVEDGGGPLFGSPEYISPEQAMGTSPDALDGRSDLYSLGVILYQMLAGELPFKGGSPMEALLAQIFTEPAPLSSGPGLEAPLAVETLLMRMLAKKRSDRPASATAIIDQLAPWEERPPAAKPLWEVQAREQELNRETLKLAPGLDENPAESLEPVETVEKERPQIPLPEEPMVSPVTAEEPASPVSSFASPAHSAESGPARWEVPVATTSAFVSSLFSSSSPAEQESEIQPPPASSSALDSFEMNRPEQAVPAEPERIAAQDFDSPEPAPMHDAFVPDLIPPPDQGMTGQEPPQGLDLHLNEGRVPQEAGKTHHGPILLGSYQPRPAKSRGHKGLKALATAALIIIILGGAGCGWLYFTGRTYWFNPNYVKSKISFYLASGAASPQTEVVEQPSNLAPPKPINTPQTAMPAQSQPAYDKNQAGPDAAQPAAAAEASSALSKQAVSTSDSSQGAQTAQNSPAGTGKSAGAAGTVGTAGAASMFQANEKPRANQNTQAAAQERAHSIAESKVVEDAITRGEYYFDRGDYDAAIQVYEDGLAQYPSNAQLTAEIARARRAKAAESKYLR